MFQTRSPGKDINMENAHTHTHETNGAEHFFSEGDQATEQKACSSTSPSWYQLDQLIWWSCVSLLCFKYLSNNISYIHQSIYTSNCLLYICLPVCVCVVLSVLSFYQSMCMSTSLSIRSVWLSMFLFSLSTYPYLSICLISVYPVFLLAHLSNWLSV